MYGICTHLTYQLVLFLLIIVNIHFIVQKLKKFTAKTVEFYFIEIGES